jgi:hypothetical protein
VTATRVALLNHAFARKFLNGANPIGHTVRTTRLDAPPAREIVGVVADAIYRDVREPILPIVYVVCSQNRVRRKNERAVVFAPEPEGLTKRETLR